MTATEPKYSQSEADSFFNDTATTEIYTLSLHDALPILWPRIGRAADASPAKRPAAIQPDRKSTRLNSSHLGISYAVFCLKKKHTAGSPLDTMYVKQDRLKPVLRIRIGVWI